MSEHTKGQLHTGGDGTIIYDHEGWGVANATVFHSRQEPGTSSANARRLALCWNACDGISTEVLETTNKTFAGSWFRAVEIQAQRDNYRAVLEGAEYRDIEGIGRNSVEDSRLIGETAKACTLDIVRARDRAQAQCHELISAFEEVLRISDRDHEAWHRARAAIAAVKGPQWKPHVWKTGGPGEGASSFLLSGSTLDALPLTGPTIAQLQDAGHLPTDGEIVASISDELGPARSLEDLKKIAKDKGYTMTTAVARKIMDAREAKKAKGGAQ